MQKYITTNVLQCEYDCVVQTVKQQLSIFSQRQSFCMQPYFIFDERLTFSNQLSSLLCSYSHISELSVLTSILKQPVPLLPLLSTLNLTTVTLSTTIFLSLN